MNTLKAFIVYRTYRIIENKSYVYLFGRLENGESFLTINLFKPYFYIKESDLKKANNIAKFDTQKTSFKNMNGEIVIKIILDIPKDVSTLRKAFENSDIPCYEADIRFTQRFLMKKGIFSTMNISGEFKKGHLVNRIYEEPELTPVDYEPKLEVLSIDIETAPNMKELYSISLKQGEKERVLFVRRDQETQVIEQLKELKYVEIFVDEKICLERLKELIIEWDPDIITGWNFIDFDLKVLKDFFEKYKLEFKFGRADWPNKLRIESEFFRDSKAEVPGRMVLDGIHILKSSFIQLDDYKLGTAAKELIGEKKLIEKDDKTNKVQKIVDAYNNNPKELCEYNLKDSDLVLKILKKKKLIELTILRSKLVGLTLESVRQSIASFDSVYIRRLNEKGLVAPSNLFKEKPEPIKGGFVMESKPGIYDNIIVMDFKSLYPSIIRTLNIDPVSYQPNKKLKNSNKEFVVTENKAVFKNEKGLLPNILEELWQQRDKAKKEKDYIKSSAIKVLMNSFFGVLASPNCRFFNMKIANAITHTGQFINKLTSKEIEKFGYEVIYADTDSCFVNPKTKDYEEAKKIGKKIEEEINDFLKKYVLKNYYRESFLELELEKVFKVLLMPTTRGGTGGAKKRYAGILVDKNGKEEIAFTGLEFVRKDWTEVSKKFQLKLLDLIFHKKEITTFVKEFVNDIKAGKYDDLLVYVKSLRKSTADYTKTTPPHVKAARIIEEHEKIIDNNIYYLITVDGPQPIKYKTSEIDYDHYIEKQIKPIADSVLMFYDTSFDDLMSGTKQKTLFGF